MKILNVNNVSKYYHIGGNKFNIFKEVFFKKKKSSYAITALESISFSLNKGEAFGVIGRNGAGKSTLLQIIAGTLKLSNGSIEINGRVSALLELGSGFNPDFTGIENIYLAGAILGIKRHEIDAKIDSIKDFADIGDYINEPVRTYSSGMLMRVAFSVAVAVEPDLLIIDEALSVGDILFQQKCNNRLRELLHKGVSLLVVTHDTSFVLNICKNALWIENGRALYIGTADECVKRYLVSMAARSGNLSTSSCVPNQSIGLDQPNAAFINLSMCKILGDQDVVVHKLWILDINNNQSTVYKSGNKCHIYILLKSNTNLRNISAGLELRDRHGQIIFVTGLRVMGATIPVMKQNELRMVKITFDLNLGPGQYTIDVGCGSGDNSDVNTYHRVMTAAILEVIPNPNDDIIHGIVKLPYSINY